MMLLRACETADPLDIGLKREGGQICVGNKPFDTLPVQTYDAAAEHW